MPQLRRLAVGEGPWTPLRKSLSDSTVVLISTGGVHLRSDRFGVVFVMAAPSTDQPAARRFQDSDGRPNLHAPSIPDQPIGHI